MKNLLKRFVKDERGLETVEWAVMAALIVSGLIVIIAGLGDAISAQFTALTDEITP